MEQWQYEQAREFIQAVPWRQVKEVGYEDTPVAAAPDPHQYVVLDWEEVDRGGFWNLARLIRNFGYLGRYSPPYDPARVMTNRYLELDGHIYWATGELINRQKAEHRQHEIIAPAGGGGPGAVHGRRPDAGD